MGIQRTYTPHVYELCIAPQLDPIAEEHSVRNFKTKLKRTLKRHVHF